MQVNQWKPQQVNPWEPWPVQVQQQAHNVMDLNLAPIVQQELNIAPLAQLGIQLDLNGPTDPMEVIINPVNPPPNHDYLELNVLIEEVEEHIPQVQEPALNPE